MQFSVLPSDETRQDSARKIGDVLQVVSAAKDWSPRAEDLDRRSFWLDRVFAVTVLISTAPLLLAIALAIKAEAPRAPILFRQWRTGLGGRRFKLWKFRTMVPEAERTKPALAHLSLVAWPDFKVPDDPRITGVGRILRRFAIDEIPNFVNVLMGDMKVVGPRPTSFPASSYAPWQRARLRVPPGVTGAWQIARAREEGFDARVAHDLRYIAIRDLGTDLRILAATIPAVLRRRAAY
ncbi:MAG: sugar transferase [Gemmatimonadetes bacterium]|nr:sugar transferase [Gemmatimonadota bacterium]